MLPTTTTKPTVNLIAKSQLARLLATENISIEHSAKAKTASFNTDTRKLILPIWDRASVDVYDMLVAHEVGHALNTPTREVYLPECERISPKNPLNFFPYLNIVEDIRVDSKMKEMYPGVRRSYFSAYKELIATDFFSLKGKDISSLTFGDRVNIYSKAGQYGHIQVAFTAEEQILVDEAMRVTTFDEVIAVAEKIYNMSRKSNTETSKQKNQANAPKAPCNGGQGSNQSGGNRSQQGQHGQTGSGQGMSSPASEQDQSDEQGEGSGAGESEESQQGEESPSDTSGESDSQSTSAQEEAPALSTDSALTKGMRSLQSNNTSEDYMYRSMPRINLDQVIFPYKRIAEDFIGYSLHPNYGGDAIFAKIVDRNKSFVLNLVKQFEQKMAADTLKRTKSGRTGKLDMRRICNYKFSDDLFLKNTTVQAGKNHGMVFIMDWSGSMGDYLLPTVEQLIALALFCRRMNIPFEVYGFTNQSPDCVLNSYRDDAEKHNEEIVAKSVKMSPDYKTKEVTYPAQYGQPKRTVTEVDFGDFLRVENIGLINFLSSKMSATEFKQSAGLFCQLAYNSDCSGTDLRNGISPASVTYGNTTGDKEADKRIEKSLYLYGLSSTPLCESAYVAIDIVNRFKSQNRLDIVNTVFLTDGEPTSSVLGCDSYSSYEKNLILNLPTRQQRSIFSKEIKTKYEKSFGQGMMELCGIVEVFKEMTGSNAIAIHLTNKRCSSQLARRYSHLIKDKMRRSPEEITSLLEKDFKNNGFFSAPDCGFTESFIIDAKTEIVEASTLFDDLKENASVAQIAKTFIKGNVKQSTSRVLLARFSDLIAKKVIGT